MSVDTRIAGVTGNRVRPRQGAIVAMGLAMAGIVIGSLLALPQDQAIRVSTPESGVVDSAPAPEAGADYGIRHLQGGATVERAPEAGADYGIRHLQGPVSQTNRRR